jgi:ectoine hydroxylase-related dioxygenase (phytanoyl-CoA dioxygenase family)
MTPAQRRAFDQDGYLLVPGVLEDGTIEQLSGALAHALTETATERAKRGPRGYGMRHLLRDVPEAASVAGSSRIRSLVEPLLGNGAFPVRGLYFDKTGEANWLVGWHQDLQIAVARRLEVPGFGPWSVRDGVTHVQPPTEVLQRIVTVRLHLDASSAANGSLRVIPGSHLSGRLQEADVAHWISRQAAVTCEAPRGSALLMRPLLLHASSRATSPGSRRVVHLEFANETLPGGLAWAVT